jgi:hypothetical protein
MIDEAERARKHEALAEERRLEEDREARRIADFHDLDSARHEAFNMLRELSEEHFTQAAANR